MSDIHEACGHAWDLHVNAGDPIPAPHHHHGNSAPIGGCWFAPDGHAECPCEEVRERAPDELDALKEAALNFADMNNTQHTIDLHAAAMEYAAAVKASK